MKSLLSRASAVLAALALVAAPAAAGSWGSKAVSSEKIFGALEAEMARSLQRLRQDEFGAPYFLAYRLHDARHYEVSATLGAVIGDDLEEYRVAYAEARYGDPAFDNTDLSYQGVNLPSPPEPDVLRQTFWMLTDQAYKGAVSGWLEKRAKRATEFVAEPLDDFSPEPPQKKVEESPAASLDRTRLRELAMKLSAVFRDFPDVYESNVTIGAWWARRFLLTSEGTRLLTPAEEMPHELRISGATRADDGMRLEDGVYLSLRSFSDLPPDAELERQARAIAGELTLLRAAPVQDAEAAPAILDPEMSGVLFHEALGHKLEGQRQRDPHESQVFRDLIGKVILPPFISVYDDPTLKSFRGSALHGSYEFDSEGSPARRVALVEKGVLRNFLMSRWPVKGFPSTNGHGRADWRSHATGRMANLIVSADGAVTLDELQKKLLGLVRAAGKPYGFLLVGSSGGENPTNRESAQTLEVRPRLIYRVDATTGARTLVRGVKLVGTPLVVLNRIVGAGNDPTLANGFHCGAESGWVPVSQIAPSLLVSEIELRLPRSARARPYSRPPSMITVSLLLAVFMSGNAGATGASEASLERAMQTELSRSKHELKDEGYPGIYFAALDVWDLEDWDRWSAMGSPRAVAWMSQRIVLPDVRVGSPALDNHPDTPRGDYLGTPVSIADDEFALRHALWRIFDGAYKTATADFLRKQARVVSQGKADYDTDDLAPEPSFISTATRSASPWDRDRLARLEDALSEPFRRDPSLLYAESHVNLRRLWTRRRDTDGLKADKSDDSARIEIEAAALSPDGLRETVSRDWSARAPQDLPSEAELRRTGRELLADLQELRVAATTSPFSAPALLDSSVSGALVFALGQRLSGEEQRNPAGAQTFRGRLGQRVLGESLTLTDDPTLKSFRGRPLFGHYEFDDEGVPARRVTLIERGLLKGFLLSRYPVKGFARSNGHARATVGITPTGTPGAMFLTSSSPQPVEKLLARLREECLSQQKPYGLWIRDLRAAVQQQGGGGQGSIRFVARVDLVEAATGKLTRVRDLDLVGTPLVMAESVTAAGDDPDASDIYLVAPTSVIAPSLLLAEAELQRSETKPEKGPILPPPQPFVPEPEHHAAPGVEIHSKGALIQVDRYLLTGWTEAVQKLDTPGVVAWRQTRTPDGIVIDVKIVGGDPAAAAAAVRRAATAVESIAQGGVHKTVLAAMRSLGSYRASYEDGWPDDGPR